MTDADARAQEAREGAVALLRDLLVTTGVVQTAKPRAGGEWSRVELIAGCFDIYADAKADAEGQRQALAVLEECQAELERPGRGWHLEPGPWWDKMRAHILAGEFGKVKHGDD